MIPMMNIFRQAGFVVVLVMLLGVHVRGQQALDNVPPELVAYPDWVVYNGKIVSMDDATLNNSVGTTYQAMAIRGDRIQFLGSNNRMLSYAGPQTRRLDLKGRTVVPGLIDTHVTLSDVQIATVVKEDAIRRNLEGLLHSRAFGGGRNTRGTADRDDDDSNMCGESGHLPPGA